MCYCRGKAHRRYEPMINRNGSGSAISRHQFQAQMLDHKVSWLLCVGRPVSKHRCVIHIARLVKHFALYVGRYFFPTRYCLTQIVCNNTLMPVAYGTHQIRSAYQQCGNNEKSKTHVWVLLKFSHILGLNHYMYLLSRCFMLLSARCFESLCGMAGNTDTYLYALNI